MPVYVKRKSRAVARIAGVVALSAMMTPPLAHAADKVVRINQAFQSLLYLPLYVAQEKGFFKAQHVDVRISTGGGGSQSWAAVVGGSADFSIQDPIFVPKSRENGGDDAVVVAAVQNAPSVFVIAKDATPIPPNAAAFSGKRVITSPEPDTTWAFMAYLARQHQLKNLKLVHVAIGNEIPAMMSGNADYALAVEPQVTQSIHDNGFHVVYSFPDNKDWSPYAFSSLTSTKTYVTKEPAATQGVVTALQLASRYIYAHPDDAAAIAQKVFSDLPKDVVTKAVQREIQADGYPHDVLVGKPSWDNALKIALFAKNVAAYPSPATSYEANVDTAFATKAQQTTPK